MKNFFSNLLMMTWLTLTIVRCGFCVYLIRNLGIIMPRLETLELLKGVKDPKELIALSLYLVVVTDILTLLHAATATDDNTHNINTRSTRRR